MDRPDAVRLRIEIARTDGARAVGVSWRVSQAEANRWISYWSDRLDGRHDDDAPPVVRVICRVEA